VRGLATFFVPQFRVNRLQTGPQQRVDCRKIRRTFGNDYGTYIYDVASLTFSAGSQANYYIRLEELLSREFLVSLLVGCSLFVRYAGCDFWKSASPIFIKI